jgi:molybdopterin converting factor subunit 1
MRVQVLFFGILKDVAGRDNDSVELPDGSTVADVLRHYEARIPTLHGLLPSVALSVNQHYAAPGTVLEANDEVALLPPVSGGTSP